MLATTSKLNQTASKSKGDFLTSTSKPDSVKRNTPKSNIPFDFANIALDAFTRIQPKLRINSPGDRYEQEADRIAEQVMRMPKGGHANPNTVSEVGIQRRPLAQQISFINGTSAQRKCSKCEEDEHASLSIQRKSNTALTQLPEKNKQFNLSLNNDVLLPKKQDITLNNTFIQKLSSLKSSGGEPLNKKSKKEFERPFGVDLGEVRIHNNKQSANLNKLIGGDAFTHQNHIFFNEQQYKPETSEGKKLLAHELTHTIQQRAVRGLNTPFLRLSHPKDNAEAEASTISNQIVNGKSVTVSQTLNSGVVSPSWKGIFDITTRLPESRKFSVSSGSVTVKSSARWRRPASCPSSANYTIRLWEDVWGPDTGYGGKSYPVPGTDTKTWSNLPNGTYYLEIDWGNTKPSCRIDGNLDVTT